MSAINLKSQFQVLDVVSTEVSGADNTIMTSLGDVYANGYTIPAENWAAQWGYASRPSIADPSKGDPAAQAFSYNMSSNNIILGYRDTRQQYKYGNIQPGDNVMYSGGQGRIIIKNSGSVSIMTTKGNTDGGSGSVIQLLPSGVINMASEFGGMSIAEDNVTLMSAQGSGISLNSNGTNIIGNNIVLNGAVVLGDSTATGVATMQSQMVANTLLITLATQMAAFCGSPLIAAFSGGTSASLAAAFTAWQVAYSLPTNYSLKVKAS